jgi:hypothetical protein
MRSVASLAGYSETSQIGVRGSIMTKTRNRSIAARLTLPLILIPLLSFGQTKTLIVTPNSLAFTVQFGDQGTFPQSIDVNSSGSPITFIVSAVDHLGHPDSQGGWLTVIGTSPAQNGAWVATTPTSVGVLSGVNYFFGLTTTISPYQRQLLFGP